MAGKMGGAACGQFVLCLLQIGLAIAICVIIGEQLWQAVPGTWQYNCYNYWWGTRCYSDYVCLMSTSSSNICSYTWVVGALSCVLSVVIVITALFRNRYGGRGCVCSCFVSALFGLAWWIAAGVVTTVNAKNADSATNDFANTYNSQGVNMQEFINWLYDKKDYRTAVYAMAWAEVGLFFFSTVIALMDCRAKPAVQQPAAGGYPTGAYAAGYQQPYGQQPYYGAPPPTAYSPPGAPAYGQYAAPPAGYPAPPPVAVPPPAYPPATPDPPKVV